jgi:hypothetical protein
MKWPAAIKKTLFAGVSREDAFEKAIAGLDLNEPVRGYIRNQLENLPGPEDVWSTHFSGSTNLRLKGTLQDTHSGINCSADRAFQVNNDVPGTRRNGDNSRRPREVAAIESVGPSRLIVLEVDVVHNANVSGITGQDRLNHVARSSRDFVVKKVHRLSGLSSIVASITVPVEEGVPRARILWIAFVASFEDRRQSKSRIIPAIRLPTMIATTMINP